METPESAQISLAGYLIASSPLLLDPNFNESVVLVSGHSTDSGAIGVIINRPTDQSLANLREDVQSPLLRNLPVYEGGPVASSEILLVAWHWNLQQKNFRLYFGLDADNLQHLIDEQPSVEARAFLGYSGWGVGQLEDELRRQDWAPCAFSHALGKLSPELLWKRVLREARPQWSVVAEMPDDPSVN